MSSTNKVQAVLQCAKRTFARRPSTPPKVKKSGVKPLKFVLPPEEFNAGLKELSCLLGAIRASDLNLENSTVLREAEAQKRGDILDRDSDEHDLEDEESPIAAPVTYIKILEDADVSIGIFVVRPGSQIPLHNHPEMIGLLKVG